MAEATIHGSPHPADAFAHGQAQKTATRSATRPADGVQTVGHGDAPDPHGGHGGHGGWHGPHEAPKPMTFALVTLAVGAVAAGLVGVPAALGGSNAIETFLHPSFTAHAAAGASPAAAAVLEPGAGSAAGGESSCRSYGGGRDR